ncbi:hypothetical protein Pmar_PMAR008031 [Perkinsus marinus ATCC 50983]|uniref:Autophagy-related protein 9 n=1 Tax=Perkinsus marinus (strain ATCC 50983 / TXsc) TaxID=423536 RepID=C5LFK5_PERM5|nr:hypothetical protein Pmar_PMAR008031 [Perkinsus marinus ATCC 50983]EER04479.1 hypothetical protein Pmar_PMAR008031 [Perkinsus marinus ATCC 50983]|eukprot:XP_002772663.1 hypothetical protein Pmar_PMAR008031 [Perkinsus marinus ATCC 50983]
MTIKEARDAAFYYQDYLGARISIVEMTNLLMRDSSYALLLQGEESPLLSMIPPWVSLPSHFVASNAVNWVIKTLIMPCLIDEHSKQLFPEITTEEFARRLRKRLRLWGLVAFVTLIPVLMMSFLFTWLKYTDDFRSARASPLQREWTNVAKFHTREFLELPHLHRSRLNSALLPRGGGSVTETFVNMSWGTTPIQGATKRLIKYVCGSIAATLFALALWDDSPLLHVVFAGKNLLWYLAVSGTLVSLVSRSTDDGERGQTADATPLNAWVATMRLLQTKLSAVVSRQIHYLPQMSQIVQGEELNESNSACRFDFLYNFERCKASFLSVFYVQYYIVSIPAECMVAWISGDFGLREEEAELTESPSKDSINEFYIGPRFDPRNHMKELMMEIEAVARDRGQILCR